MAGWERSAATAPRRRRSRRRGLEGPEAEERCPLPGATAGRRQWHEEFLDRGNEHFVGVNKGSLTSNWNDKPSEESLGRRAVSLNKVVPLFCSRVTSLLTAMITTYHQLSTIAVLTVHQTYKSRVHCQSKSSPGRFSPCCHSRRQAIDTRQPPRRPLLRYAAPIFDLGNHCQPTARFR